VDISHAEFEEQITVVKETLQEIEAGAKPVIMVFNKIDAYEYIEKDPLDLTPSGKENLSLDELRRSWMATANAPAVFISARNKTNLDELRRLVYDNVREIHIQRYPYNDFLFEV
jgi:GTP-binding protein HflX